MTQQAAGKTVLLLQRGGTGGARDFCEFEKIEQIGVHMYRVLQFCQSFGDGAIPEAHVVRYTLSGDAGSTSQRADGRIYSARLCSQASMPAAGGTATFEMPSAEGRPQRKSDDRVLGLDRAAWIYPLGEVRMNPCFVNRFGAPWSALVWLCSAASAWSAPDWDIVGIKLGMTPAQARAALMAHAPRAEISDTTRQFTYNDGVRDQALPGFLASITARQGATLTKSETLEVMFSAPPMEQRVIRVVRHLAMVDDPLSMDRAMETVAQRYGKPPKLRAASDSRGNVLRWDEPGKTVCGDTSPNSFDGLVPPPVDYQPQALSGYEAWKRRKLAPADASLCSAALLINLITKSPRGSLVSEMKFTMTDPGYAIPAMQATAKQIADMQAQARKSRESSGPALKL